MRLPIRTSDRLPARPRGRGGFTLVELLVVIGIIGLIMSISLPTLAKVREQANAVKCATNLRSLAQAWNLYAEQNQRVSCPSRMPLGELPGASAPTKRGNGVFELDTGAQYRPRWYELLGQTIKQFPAPNTIPSENDAWVIRNELFLCPARSDWNNSRNYVYGYNHQFLGNPRPRPDGKWINWPVKADRLRSADTVMIMDSMGTAAGKPKDARQGYYFDGTKDEYGMCNKGFLVDPPRLTATSDYADAQNRSPEHRSGPDPRHNRRANVAFCDGRVESLAPQDMGYVVGPDGTMGTGGGGAHNRMFSGTGTDLDPPSVR